MWTLLRWSGFAASVLTTFLALPDQASAVLVFSEDFESGHFSRWVGKTGATQHNGSIVGDPLESDHALTFTALNSGGDLFSEQTFSSPANKFVLSFDYLGIPGNGGISGNLGGFAGYAYGLPGNHQWLAGTVSCCAGFSGINAPDILPDIGQWVHVTIPFTSLLSGSIRLTFEDFVGSFGSAGDIYFDNIVLESVPEPSGAILFVAGIVVLLVAARRARLLI